MFWPCIAIIVVCTTLVEAMASYKKQKLIEEHKTNNLALAYQILSARSDMTMDDVQHLIDMNDAKGLPKNN